jgi:hypothetical protein
MCRACSFLQRSPKTLLISHGMVTSQLKMPNWVGLRCVDGCTINRICRNLGVEDPGRFCPAIHWRRQIACPHHRESDLNTANTRPIAPFLRTTHTSRDVGPVRIHSLKNSQPKTLCIACHRLSRSAGSRQHGLLNARLRTSRFQTLRLYCTAK